MTPDNSFSEVDFIEIAVRDEDRRNLEARLESRRFEEVDELEQAAISLWERDGVRLLLNHSHEGYASDFKARQGTGPVSIGLLVDKPQATWRRAIENGAWPVGEYIRPDLPFPALFGPDDVLVYFTTGLRKSEDVEWLRKTRATDSPAAFSIFVDGEPARREWNFWFDEVIAMPLREPAQGQGQSGLRFSSRSENADLFFARSRAVRGLSFAGLLSRQVIQGPWNHDGLVASISADRAHRN